MWIKTLVPALLIAMLASTALGQGTSGMVPDPIGALELSRGLTRLELSPQQLQAVNALHDTYRVAYEDLRENDIAQFMEETNALRRGMRWTSDRKAVEQSSRSYEQLVGKIRRLDDRLFDEIGTLLSEEQTPYLDRARQARERARYRSGLTRWVAGRNPAAQVDLSAVVLDIDPPADHLAEIDPTLEQYERTLTARVKSLNEAATNLPIESLKRLEAMGFTQDAMSDPEQRVAMFEAMRAVWEELYADIGKRTSSISDLNQRTYKNMAVVLPDEWSRKLRDEYYTRAYPDVPSTPAVAERSIAAALRLDGLTGEQRSEITALRDQLRRDLDRITEQAITVVDEAREQQRGFWSSGGDDGAEQDLEALLERRRVAQNQAIRTLEGLLGAELSDRVRTRLVADGDGESADAMGGGAGGASEAVQDLAAGQAPDDFGFDPFLPGPVTGRALEGYAERLGVDEAMLPLLEGVHEDYMRKYEELSRTTLTPLRTARWRMRGSDEEPATAQDVEALFEKRRGALEAILELDRALFDEIALVLDEEESARLERVVLARQRGVFNRGLDGQSAGAVVFGRDGGGGRRNRNFWFGDDASHEASVDVATIAESLALSDAEQAAADTVLQDYEETVVAAFREAFEANLRLQEAAWTLRVRGDEAERSGENRWRRIGSEYRQMVDSVGRNVSDAKDEIVALNRGAVAQLGKVVSAQTADDLEREYRRRAFERIYQDQRSANELLDVTLDLDDLTTDQRMRVNEIAATYRSEYDGLCNRMVEIQVEAADADRGDWSARQERWQRLERIRFERDELSDKTRLRIRATLREDQVQRLGGLADPPPEEEA